MNLVRRQSDTEPDIRSLTRSFQGAGRLEEYPIRTLLVTFRHNGPQLPIGAFRGGIVEKVGRQHTLFHNHDDAGGSLYRYPLIQYKRVDGQPVILCLGTGVEEIHRLFLRSDWTVDILGQPVRLQVDRLDLRTHNLRLSPRWQTYRLSNWQGLNRENRMRFHAARNAYEQKAMLERILTANMLAFAKGIGWQVEGRVLAEVPEPPLLKTRQFKGIDIDVFDLELRTNMVLPEAVGLGKAVSIGYGVLERIETNQI